MRERVLAEVPKPTTIAMKSLHREGRVLAMQCGRPDIMSYQAFVDSYVGKKKQRYQSALNTLRERPLQLPYEASVKAFVKPEKWSPVDKVNPAPRMVQARSPRFNVEIGVFLKPIEHELYKLTDRFGLPLVGKGLSPTERGMYLRHKWECFRNPVCVSIDASRWDMHVSREMLEVEHAFYLRIINNPWFARLLKCQLDNTVVTMCGLKYKTHGRRMSGDMNTALGNCCLMIMCVRYAMRVIGIRKYTIFDDGDDCLLLFERDHLELLTKSIGGCFNDLGHVVKIENIATQFEKIVWCQTQPVCVGGVWMMIREWKRALSNAVCGIEHFQDRRALCCLAFAIGQCFLALSPGVPIHQKMGEVLCRFTNVLDVNMLSGDWLYKVEPVLRAAKKKLGSFKPVEVQGSTRDSFALAFDCDHLQQMHIESVLDAMVFSDIVDVGVEMLPNWRQTLDLRCDPALL
nr:MAG: RNA-dependent RNA polymerase [Chemarfal virus 178]